MYTGMYISHTCLQGTLWGEGTLWSGDVFSEQCPIFLMLRKLWWKDTCHVMYGTLSLGYSGVPWRQVLLYTSIYTICQQTLSVTRLRMWSKRWSCWEECFHCSRPIGWNGLIKLLWRHCSSYWSLMVNCTSFKHTSHCKCIHHSHKQATVSVYIIHTNKPL